MSYITIIIRVKFHVCKLECLSSECEALSCILIIHTLFVTSFVFRVRHTNIMLCVITSVWSLPPLSQITTKAPHTQPTLTLTCKPTPQTETYKITQHKHHIKQCHSTRPGSDWNSHLLLSCPTQAVVLNDLSYTDNNNGGKKISNYIYLYTNYHSL